MAAVWSAGQLAAAVLPGGLQPMTSMLEQNLLQMAAAHDPSWIAMCDVTSLLSVKVRPRLNKDPLNHSLVQGNPSIRINLIDVGRG